MLRLTVSFFVLNALVQCVPLPKMFVPCHMEKEDFKECLNKNIASAIHSLKEGAPELKIKPIDPTYVSSANIGRGTGAVDVAQNYTDVNIYGVSDVKEVNVKNIDPKKFTIEFEATFPYLRWQADYKASGKILLLPIYGDGPSNITLIDTKGMHKIKGDFFTKKDGKTYMRCASYDLRLDPKSATFKFDNLFNGNKLLGDNMNQVMNDNWEDLYKDVRSGYEDVMAAVYQNYCNNVFSKVPFEEIFL